MLLEGHRVCEDLETAKAVIHRSPVDPIQMLPGLVSWIPLFDGNVPLATYFKRDMFGR